ncbi:uncharacterized protein ColSpa_06878 [Colletotrichum spaethianum]|uniref:C6 zinc finger protein n=1 Tax=Colletotrichum spaethianum TaxID=700344 RepID=A0AA37LDV3_9PEZI|nr:uncharacterized protein ColSpa_06878 [Colletotrichum spaethianum]GKT46697.1 hypothetical protein ColSpa_06878 [Colletotrichum spaethianum]
MDSPMDGSGGSSSAPGSTPTATATTPGAGTTLSVAMPRGSISAASVASSSTITAAATAGGGVSTPGAAIANTGAAVVSRRSHPKSRTGCRTFPTPLVVLDPAVPGQHPFLRRPDNGHSFGDGLGVGAGGGGGGMSDLSLNLIDLELMHNFTTFAFNTLSTDPVVRQMWKVPVVKLALECDYVMRALLSVSALHLAHNRPERRDFFISRALTYHQMASRTAMGLMGALDGENCEKLYLFSVLTIFFALACPRKSSDSLIMGESSFPDWMFLLRGTKSLLKLLQPQAYTGPLLPMFNHGRERFLHSRDESRAQPELLADLQRLVNKTCADPVLLPIYNRAIDELRRTLSVFLWDGGRGMDITDAFLWKYLMAEDFLPLLKVPGATQEAVAIFSHFCILLKRLENEWWLQGWATHLISRAWSLLDQDHRLWIQWPIEELGWVPP